MPGCTTCVRPSASAAWRAAASMWRGSVRVSSSSMASGGAGKPACVADLSIDTGLQPSPSSAAASSTSVPNTRRGEEPARVADDDRRLADGPHEVVRPGQGGVGRLLADDDLDQRHLVHRREEVQAEEIGAAVDAVGQPGDGQRRGVGGEQRVRCGAALSASPSTWCLRATSSKTASITRSHPARSSVLSVAVMRRRSVIPLCRPCCDPSRSPCPEPIASRPCPSRHGSSSVSLSTTSMPGLGRRVGDAGTHHPRPEHGHLRRPPRLVALRTRLTGVDRLEVEEEGLGHVLELLVADQVDEVARLDPGRGVEVDLRALDGGGEDRPRRRVRSALGLLAQGRRGRRAAPARARASRGCRRGSGSRRGPTAASGPARRRRGRAPRPVLPAPGRRRCRPASR